MGTPGVKLRRPLLSTPSTGKEEFHGVNKILHWTLDNHWKSVIFSDETQVKLNSKNRISVWRRSDEVWRPECLGQRGGSCVSVMFWGCLSYNGVGTLEPVVGKIDS